MTRSGTSTFFFLALASALAYLNWYAWNDPITSSTEPTRNASEPTALGISRKSEPKVQIAGLDAYKETLERPLFQNNRRPFVPEPPNAEALTEPQPAATATTPPVDRVAPQTASEPAVLANVRLLGTMKAGAKMRRALLQLDGRSKAEWVEVGSLIGDWKLSEIRDENVVVESAGSQAVVELRPVRRPSSSAQ